MKIIQFKFVEFIPSELNEGVLYISIEYKTAVHRCICGCGNKVVTPLTPTDWEITYDGKTVSLSPSIGNWNFKCKSHYWITKNKVRFARMWSEKEIADGRKKEQELKTKYYKKEINNNNG